MLTSDISAIVMMSPTHQQTSYKTEQSEVQQASISGHAKVSMEVAAAAVKAVEQLDVPNDKAESPRNEFVFKPSSTETGKTEVASLTEGLRQKLEDMASEALGDENTRFSILFDESTDRFIYQTRDKRTGEVVKQYPSEEFLNQLIALRKVSGLAFEKVV
jgi:flagellar protein FlaG